MRFILALLITILIHLLLFFQFEIQKEKFKEPKRKVKKPAINLSNVKLKQEIIPEPKVEKPLPIVEKPKIEQKPIIEEKIVKKVEPKPKIEKKVKKEPIKETKAKKIIEREVVKVEQKSKEIKEAKIKSSEENLSLIVFEALQNKKIEQLKEPKKEQNLMSFLKTPVSPSKSKAKLKQQPLKELYEDEFEYLSKEEKEFLEDNLAMIGYITQKHLEYPEIAGMTGQEGINVVEFFLFPNGDISEVKVIKGSTYTMLDKNSIKTIEYAYKEYPRPKQKTKIRIYTHYKIVGY